MKKREVTETGDEIDNSGRRRRNNGDEDEKKYIDKSGELRSIEDKY